MSTQLINDLDEALTRYQDQEALADILADFSDEAEALRPLLETAAFLDILKPVALPDEALLAAESTITEVSEKGTQLTDCLQRIIDDSSQQRLAELTTKAQESSLTGDEKEELRRLSSLSEQPD